MRSSTEATRLGGVHYAGFVAPNVSLHCDSELQTRSEQTGHAVRARFAAVHESRSWAHCVRKSSVRFRIAADDGEPIIR
jgi:hypothetical protein